jgi:hypothetical protein
VAERNGEICVWTRIQEDCAGRLDLSFDDLGEQRLKNIARPVRVYRVRVDGVEGRSTVEQVDVSPVLPLPDDGEANRAAAELAEARALNRDRYSSMSRRLR